MLFFPCHPSSWCLHLPALPAILRTYFCQALANDCLVQLASGTSALLNLDESLLSFKATAFVQHKVWGKVAAAADEVAKFKAASELAADVAKQVFYRHKAFSHLPPVPAASPEILQKWCDSGFALVQPFVPEEVAEKFKGQFLSPLQHDLENLFSKGLERVGPIVSKCAKGLLGAGLSKQVRDQTLQSIPASHDMKAVVDLFLQALLYPVHHGCVIRIAAAYCFSFETAVKYVICWLGYVI